MSKQIGNCLMFSLVVLLLVCVMGAYSQEEVAKAPFKPAEPPRLYVAPTADIIPSLDFSFAASGSVGAKGFSYQGTTGFGLADIAQIEAHAIGIISGLEEGEASIVYAPGFKMKLLPRDIWKHPWVSSPLVAWSLRSSAWSEKEEKNITYKEKIADLYFVVTERLGPERSSGQRLLAIHLGVDIMDARLTTDVMEKRNKENPEEPKEAKKSAPLPFAGLDVWLTDRGKAMAEFGWVPDFDHLEDGIQKDENIDFVWKALLGVRFFLTRYTAIDVGVKYQGNYEGVSDANIEAKFDTFIPTHLLYDYARGKR